MSQITAIVQRIVMNADFNVSFYDQYNNLLITLETATDAQVVGTYLICGDSDGNSIKFFVNEITSIEGPDFSQTYTPIPAGFYQQDQAYFNRLSEIYNYVHTNVVNVVIRWIDALKFADGTTQTTAATGGGGSGTVTSVGFTAGTGITLGGINPITTSGSVTITNSAPDQVVTLTEGAGIDITGTYPNFTIANTVAGGIPKGTTSGTDTYTTTISGVTAYNDGDAYLIRFTIGNTTGCTLNINSLGAKNLYRNNDGLLVGGDIVDGAEMFCIYNSTLNGFQVIGTAPNTLLAYVTNAEATTITKGQPVYAFGGQGDRLTVKLAYNTGDSTSAQTVGLVLSTSIGANQKGLIMVTGPLDGLNLFPTSTWADGNPVYLGATAGTVTNVKPHAPNHLVYLGFVTTASNGSAGRMYVRVQNGYEMDELHDVSAQTPSNNDGLFFNTSTSLWESKSIATALGYTPGTVTSIATTSPILGGPITNSGTISIQQADSTNNGYLSSTDWVTFRNKQDQLNGTGFVKASGTTISYDNTSYYPASNPANFGSGTVTSVAALTLGTSGTDLSSSVATGTTTPVITLNVPTASASNRGALSSTDWSTFNSKQNAISLTTSGNSGPATLVGSTLNIPQYAGSGTGSSFVLISFSASGFTAGATRFYWNGGAGGTTAEAQLRTPFPEACTASKLYLRTTGTMSASASLVVTLIKNGSTTALTVTVAGGSAAGTYADTSNSVSFAAGDGYAIQVTNPGSVLAAAMSGISFKITI